VGAPCRCRQSPLSPSRRPCWCSTQIGEDPEGIISCHTAGGQGELSAPSCDKGLLQHELCVLHTGKSGLIRGGCAGRLGGLQNPSLLLPQSQQRSFQLIKTKDGDLVHHDRCLTSSTFLNLQTGCPVVFLENQFQSNDWRLAEWARTCRMFRARRISPLDRVTRAFIPSSVISTLTEYKQKGFIQQPNSTSMHQGE
jgi:hypothetical protein